MPDSKDAVNPVEEEVRTLAELRERLRASEERSRRAEEALRQSHEKFAKAFQSSPDFARVLAG